ncbi:MAG: selenoneine biosynthesis selenosugar synthase SenB [Burkholderiales bacterium]
MNPPVVRIVTPARSDANNGNWRTAQRWAGFLRDEYAVILQAADAPWPGAAAGALIALHATRSHDAIRRWRETGPRKPVILILTGTDLYRDLPRNELARESLRMADRLVVLQRQALRELPPELRAKACAIHQSAKLFPERARPGNRLNCIFVGHLRDEKDPMTAVRAWQYLPRHLPITLTLVGDALDERLARAVRAAQGKDSRLRWLGAMPHEWTLRAIQRTHLLVNSSRMEGGAHVVAEAVRAAAPVLASRMPGNVGMLGRSYPGYFEVGDSRALAQLLRDCLQRQTLYGELLRQTLRMRGLFAPGRERAAVRRLVAKVLGEHKIRSMEDL